MDRPGGTGAAETTPTPAPAAAADGRTRWT